MKFGLSKKVMEWALFGLTTALFLVQGKRCFFAGKKEEENKEADSVMDDDFVVDDADCVPGSDE